MSDAPLIRVRDLVMRYDDQLVLDSLSLDVMRGETVVIIGSSGSGKTTLARLIVGLERPTSGEVLLGGVDVCTAHGDALMKLRARFAMVFQKYALLDSLSVFDNVAFPLREETHLSEAEIRERVMKMLGELGVEGAEKQLPGELSGGMSKRVGIARAMVMEPEIIVYDEPTSGLDPLTSRVVDGLIEGLRERHFVTSIVISHDMVSAYDIADRVVLLAHGKVAADGPPETIFRSHDSEVQPFATASGMDLARLGSRKSRPTATEIAARWVTARAASERVPAKP